MPYKTTTAASNKGTPMESAQIRLANATKIHNDGAFGDELISTRNTSDAFPPFAMSALADDDNNTNNTGVLKVSLSSRRRQASGQNVKGPQGPRLLDTQITSRSTSGSMPQPFGSLRGTNGTTAYDAFPASDDVSAHDIPQFSFASIDTSHAAPKRRAQEEDGTQIGNFLEPKFDFDAFHDNIVATSPRLDGFPRVGLPTHYNIPDIPDVPKAESKKVPAQAAIPVPTRKISGAGSIGRKGSTASTRSRLSISKLDPMGQTATAATSILRGRRQTHFPPNAFNNAPTPPVTAKAPRKSVGPNTFTVPDSHELSEMKRRPSVGGRKSSAEGGKGGLTGRSVQRDDGSSREASKSPSTIRVKSLHNPNRQSTRDYTTPAKTPEGLRSTSLNVQSTPNRRSGTPGRTTTPGATNRRQSVATGLGARTISPTDARRLKRMSMVPPAPPLPATRISQAPPTPQPDFMLQIIPHSAAPGTGKRKSMTPSSSRTTPDPNRKSYSSGQSLSSNTTYGSLKNTGTITAKLAQQNVSTSRLPTPKPRTESSESPVEEEIPPVPAIPKSYESPASETDQPFFSARSSSLQQADTPISEKSIGFAAAEAFARLNIPDEFNESILLAEQEFRSDARQKRDFSDMDLSGRVPPLGLLPFIAPISDKTLSLNGRTNKRLGTPEDGQKIKTPSTPMTASKASLFTKADRIADYGSNQPMRSTTSHFVVRSDDSSAHDNLSPNIPSFAFDRDSSSHRSVSPFLSTSAPKTSHEFPSYMRPNFTAEFRRVGSQARPNGPRAPSYSIPVKVGESKLSLQKSSESSASTSTSSIQQTLSRTKPDIKPVEAVPHAAGSSMQNEMPPPKLPASATWHNLSGVIDSPTQKPSFFKSRRKTSASSNITLASSGLERADSYDSVKPPSTHGRPSIDSVRSLMTQPNRSASLLSSGALVKPSSVFAISEPGLDRDDLVAEEEMKKLASKRRDFETAARQLDALRARAKAADCVSPEAALHTINLNIYERGEIVDFPDVYFTGVKKAKKIVGDLASSSSNFGYDDDRGDYNIVEGDHLAYRYEVVDVLGKGSFGQVVRCIDHKTGILVAIKIIRNKKRFHQQALVEVDILQKLKEWDPLKKYNVVNFDQSFYFRGHLCISTDLLDMNLYEFIKAHDFKGFSVKLIRRFTKQMLQSLVLLHGKKVIHCDLKPENILLAHPAHSEIKVIDFGSSCFEHEKVYTYIQSRFYRSPEVILGMSYGMPIDMWSLGCILAELYTGYPIFPGENEQEQLACIMEIFGPPEKHLIEKSSRKKLFFDSMGKPRLTVSSKGRRRRPSSKDLRSVLKCDDEAFLDFITRCLRWDPTRRMNPHEALRHEFITGLKPAPVSTRKHIANALSTPLKRGNSIAVASSRPLPQPPPSSLKPIVSVRQDSLAPSPSKPVPRRQSNANSVLHVASQAKRASHAAMSTVSGSTTGRFLTGQRTANSRADLATAAAAASLVK